MLLRIHGHPPGAASSNNSCTWTSCAGHVHSQSLENGSQHLPSGSESVPGPAEVCCLESPLPQPFQAGLYFRVIEQNIVMDVIAPGLAGNSSWIIISAGLLIKPCHPLVPGEMKCLHIHPIYHRSHSKKINPKWREASRNEEKQVRLEHNLNARWLNGKGRSPLYKCSS